MKNSVFLAVVTHQMMISICKWPFRDLLWCLLVRKKEFLVGVDIRLPCYVPSRYTHLTKNDCQCLFPKWESKISTFNSFNDFFEAAEGRLSIKNCVLSRNYIGNEVEHIVAVTFRFAPIFGGRLRE